MAINARDRKLLWGRSGNRCAKCKQVLVMPEREHDREAIVGEECHILPQAPDGPRGTGAVGSDVDSYSNLILLCTMCHTLVDEQPSAHPAEFLVRLRQEHEGWVESSLAGPGASGPLGGMVSVSPLAGEWETEFHLDPHLPSELLFSARLADAFPGKTGTTEIAGGLACASRLSVLFREPIHQLVRDDGSSERQVHPFWWFRGHENMYIHHFEALRDGRCILGTDELNVRRVAAYRRGYPSAWDFLYIEADADPPSGVYPDERSIEERLGGTSYGHFVDEEYAQWNDHRISRQEYDDGAAIIDGVPRRIENAVVRRRFLTPYNLVVTGNRHVINESHYDRKMLTLLDGILTGTHCLDDLVAFVAGLPKSARLHTEND